MTVDSAYYPEVYALDDEVNYFFNFESIGADAVRVFLVEEDGTRVELIQAPVV